MQHDTDIIVIGGGFAGLVAARDAAASGLRVLLLEARDRVGGRAFSRPFGTTNTAVEFGGGWFDAELQYPLREEAERYDIPIGPAADYQATRWFTGGQLRSGLPVGRANGADLERIVVEMAIAGRALRSASHDQIAAIDNCSLADWLDQFQPLPETRDFIYGWSTLMTGADPRLHSALGLLATVGEAGAWSYFTELANVFPTGTTSLANAIANDIKGELRLETPVRKIRQTEAGIVVETDTDVLRAAAGIVAIPVNTMGNVAFDPPFDGQRAAAIAHGHVCKMTKVWMLATGVPDRMLAAGWGTPFHWLAAEKAVGDAQLVVAFAIEGGIDASDRGALQHALRAYAPDATVLESEFHDWVADPWALGGWMTMPLGWGSRGMRATLGAPHGRLVTAGSDVSQEFGGWIAGAVASGRLAAQQVRALLN